MNSNNSNWQSSYFYQQNESQGQGGNGTDNAASWNSPYEGYPLNATQSYSNNFMYQDGSFPVRLEEMTQINQEAYGTNQIQQPRINTNLSYPQDVCLESGDQFENIVQTTPSEQTEFPGITTFLPHQNWNLSTQQQQFDEQLQNYFDNDIPENRNEVQGQPFDSGSSTMNVSETLWEAYDSATDIYQSNLPQGESENWAESAGGLNQIQQEYCPIPAQSFHSNLSYQGGSESCQHQFPYMYHETNAPNKMHPHFINYNYNFHPSAGQQTANEYYQEFGNRVQPETFQQQSGFMHQPTYASQSENLPMPQQLQTLCQTGGPSAASHYAFQTPEQEFPSSHPNVFPNAQPSQPQVSYLPHVNIPKGQTIRPDLGGTLGDLENRSVDDPPIPLVAERGAAESNEITRSTSSEVGKLESLVMNLDAMNMADEVVSDFSLQNITIKSLEINCDGFSSAKQRYLLFALNFCPLVEDLKLSFFNFCAYSKSIRSYNSHLKSFTQQNIKFSRLKNLSILEFNSTFRCLRSQILKDGAIFYAEMYKEIIKSSGNLKKLTLKASQGAEFFRVMKADSETAVKLKHLREFRFQTPQPRDQIYIDDIMNLVSDFLAQVSSSLQVLQICGVSWENLGDYPLLPNLRILSIQFDMGYSNFTVSTQSFPKLQTLIVSYYKPSEEFNFNFGWPFDDEGGLKWNEERDFSHSFSPQLVNVVLYPTWTNLYWLSQVRKFFNSILGVSVDSVFIDLTYNNPRSDVKFECRNIRLGLAMHLRTHAVSWKRCLLRFCEDREGSPVVFDILSNS